jgi:Flp pilus assembly protein TadD
MTKLTRREQLEAMLRDDPNDPLLRYMLGMELAGGGSDDEAARHFRDLLGVAPSYVPAYMQLGRALVRLGRDDEARSVFRSGIDVANREGDAHAAGEMAGFLEGL